MARITTSSMKEVLYLKPTVFQVQDRADESSEDPQPVINSLKPLQPWPVYQNLYQRPSVTTQQEFPLASSTFGQGVEDHGGLGAIRQDVRQGIGRGQLISLGLGDRRQDG
ncbi:hypothetical protein J6590_066740 [Homalodisca vitripennis]|nr:hypothetical protein J6590_066740 [Homalodisca vitripennis]